MRFEILMHDRGRTALHEACHAVAAVVLGLHLERVLLHAEGGGRADVVGYDPERWPVVALAPAAWAYGDRDEVPGGVLSGGDAAELERALRDGGRTLQDAWDEAKALVRAYRPAIVEVARRLLEAGELDGATVRWITEMAAPEVHSHVV